MIKTLKEKIAVIYIFLILMIAVVGLTSVFSFFTLSKSVDTFMIDNYKSIDATNKMIEAIDEQNMAIVTYLDGNEQKGINNFYESSNTFFKWFNVEFNNITEPGERENVDTINSNYIEYIKLFSQMQKIKEEQGLDSAKKYNDTNIDKLYNSTKKQLKALCTLNEEAMFNRKNAVSKNTLAIMYLVLILSSISVIGGYFISKFFANKFLKPIYLLTEAVKGVKEGNLQQQTPIMTNDEIGILSHEFNNMTKRIQQFEQSNKGKLLAEKNKSIAIVKSISDPLLVLDMNFKVTLLNKAFEEVFNITESSTLNKHFLECIRFNELYDYIYKVYRESETKHSEEIIQINSNEKEYYFNVVVSIVKDNEVNINEIVVLLQNVTELKHLEKMKTDFIATISHEFKTPLTSIIMGLSLIDEENIGELNEKQAKIIETIKDGADTLTNLVTDLIHLSKIESDKAIFNMEPCSIIGIVENSMSNFYSQAETNEVNLYNEIYEDIPKINGDAEKLTWVVNNLISNSLKHTNAGDQIVVNAYIKDKKLLVSVKDSGAGIPLELQKNIFNKFIHLEEGQSEIKGSGLGLAIAKEIIEAHDGEIWCESKLDVGSNFIFTLPLAE